MIQSLQKGGLEANRFYNRYSEELLGKINRYKTSNLHEGKWDSQLELYVEPLTRLDTIDLDHQSLRKLSKT